MKKNNLMNKKNYGIKIILFFFLSLTSINSVAQNRYNLSQFAEESRKFVENPAGWHNNDWIKLGLISAGTILLTQTDQSVREIVLKDQSYFKSFPIETGRIWGEIYPTAIIAGSLGLHGLITGEETTKKIGFEIIQSAVYAGAITTFLKIAVGRARPFTNKEPGTFHPFTFFDDDFHSFPSGHATLAFSLSTVLAKNMRSDFLKVIVFLPAVLTMASRVYQDNHWVSDVFAGAAIGYFVGDWVIDLHGKQDSGTTVSLIPFSIRIQF